MKKLFTLAVALALSLCAAAATTVPGTLDTSGMPKAPMCYPLALKDVKGAVLPDGSAWGYWTCQNDFFMQVNWRGVPAEYVTPENLAKATSADLKTVTTFLAQDPTLPLTDPRIQALKKVALTAAAKDPLVPIDPIWMTTRNGGTNKALTYRIGADGKRSTTVLSSVPANMICACKQGRVLEGAKTYCIVLHQVVAQCVKSVW